MRKRCSALDPERNIYRHQSSEALALNELMILMKSVQSLRFGYAQQFFIGVCGPQNSGKSTFVNTFDIKGSNWAKTGSISHTIKTSLYQIVSKPNVLLMDFPGSTSILTHNDTFMDTGHRISTSSYQSTMELLTLAQSKVLFKLAR